MEGKLKRAISVFCILMIFGCLLIFQVENASADDIVKEVKEGVYDDAFWKDGHTHYLEDSTASEGWFSNAWYAGVTDGDWVQYDLNFETGSYRLYLNVKNTLYDPGEATYTNVDVDDVTVGSIKCKTNQWEEKSVYLGGLSQGLHVIRIWFAAEERPEGQDDVNVGWDYIRIMECTDVKKEVKDGVYDDAFWKDGHTHYLEDSTASEGWFSNAWYAGTTDGDWVKFNLYFETGSYQLYLNVKNTLHEPGDATYTNVDVDGTNVGSIKCTSPQWEEKFVYLGGLSEGYHVIRIWFAAEERTSSNDVNVGWDYIRIVECTYLKKEVDISDWYAKFWKDDHPHTVSDSTASGGSFSNAWYAGTTDEDWVEFREYFITGSYQLYLNVKNTLHNEREATYTNVDVDGDTVGSIKCKSDEWEEKSVYLGGLSAGLHVIRIWFAAEERPGGGDNVDVGWDYIRIVECTNVKKEVDPADWIDSFWKDSHPYTVSDQDASGESFSNAWYAGTTDEDWVEFKEYLPTGNYQLFLNVKNTLHDPGEATYTNVDVDGAYVGSIKCTSGQWEEKSVYLGGLSEGFHYIKIWFVAEERPAGEDNVDVGWDYIRIVECTNVKKEVHESDWFDSFWKDNHPYTVSDPEASRGSFSNAWYAGTTDEDWVEFKEYFITGSYRLYLNVKNTLWEEGEATYTDVDVDDVTVGSIKCTSAQWEEKSVYLGSLSEGLHVIRIWFAAEERPIGHDNVDVGWDYIRIVECTNVKKEVDPADWYNSFWKDNHPYTVSDLDASGGSFSNAWYAGSVDEDWVEFKEYLPTGNYQLFLNVKNTEWIEGEATYTNVDVDDVTIGSIICTSGDWEEKSVDLGDLSEGFHYIRIWFAAEERPFGEEDVNVGWDYIRLIKDPTEWSDNDNDGIGNNDDPDDDNDGMTDVWENDNGLNRLINDANQDPDNDGLTNLEEFNLNSDPTNNPDLFIELDHMTGHQPQAGVLNYIVQYFNTLGVTVHFDNDGNALTQGNEITQVTNNQLTNIGIANPDSLSPNECLLIENNFHNFPDTHVYVFFGHSENSQNIPGMSHPFAGAFIFQQTIINQANTNGWNANDYERSVLLHELGHCLSIIRYENDPTFPNGPRDANSGDVNGNNIQNFDELYCDQDPGNGYGNNNCAMARGSVNNINNNPIYCQAHWGLNNLQDKFSVNGELGIYN